VTLDLQRTVERYTMQQGPRSSSFPLPYRLSHPRDPLLGREQRVFVKLDFGQMSGWIGGLDSVHMQRPIHLGWGEVSGQVDDVGPLADNSYC